MVHMLSLYRKSWAPKSGQGEGHRHREAPELADWVPSPGQGASGRMEAMVPSPGSATPRPVPGRAQLHEVGRDLPQLQGTQCLALDAVPEMK